jgi:hypothetical protein
MTSQFSPSPESAQDREKMLEKTVAMMMDEIKKLTHQIENLQQNAQQSTNHQPIKITTATDTNNQRSPRKSPRAKTREFMPEGLYLPELDYLVYITRQRGEFLSTRYASENTLNMRNAGIAARKGIVSYYGVEAHGGAVNYVETVRHSIIIPSAALIEDVKNKYCIDHKQDFRAEGASTMYLPSIMNRNKGNSATERAEKAAKSAYTFNWLVGGGTGLGGAGLLGGGSIDAGLLGGVSTASFLQVINNTREHWLKYQTPYAKSLRIRRGK